jgi:uracil-DNA glycosylase
MGTNNEQYIGKVPVANTGPLNAKLWVVGEAPGEDEEAAGEPFVGVSGQLLRSLLLENGVSFDDVRRCNLSMFRPFNNKFGYLQGSRQLAQSQEILKNEILKNRPICIIALGTEATEYLTGRRDVANIRGSVLPCSFDFNIKVLVARHPAFVLRTPAEYPVFSIDIAHAVAESKTRESIRKKRTFIINPKGYQLEDIRQDYSSQPKLACDIESARGKDGTIYCIGFAKSPTHSVSLNLFDSQQAKVAFQLLENEQIEKIFHFGTFDYLKLAINGIPVNNYKHDTYLGQHVLNPEFARTLAFLVSTYTNEPAYKTDGRATIPDDIKAWNLKTTKLEDLLLYNCKDCCYTFEVHEIQLAELAERGLTHIYEEEIDQLEMAHHISLAGMCVDLERRDLFAAALKHKWDTIQFMLDVSVGRPFNCNSPPQCRKLLYKEYGLPVRRNKGQGITTDEDACVSLHTYCMKKVDESKKQETKNQWLRRALVIKSILAIRGLRKLLGTYILCDISDDGRIRSTYKVGGTETGRYAANSFIDDTGTNSQTFPRASIDIPKAWGLKVPSNAAVDKIAFAKQIELLGEEEEEEEAVA